MTRSSQSLFHDLIEQDPYIFVRFDGVIDEDNGLAEQLPEAQGKTILVDLARVSRINSCGVRDWVRWARALESRGNQLYLVGCCPAVVAQLNMVQNFCGDRGRVISFQAPYFCGSCDRDHREQLAAAGMLPDDSPPELVCELCGEPLEFDDLPTSYLAFLRDHNGPLDPKVAQALSRFQESDLAKKVAALKEISSGIRSGAPTTATGLRGAAGATPKPSGIK
jgi:anti-anti-sigma regulatory factor